MFCVSDGTRKLDRLFGLSLEEPFKTTEDAKRRIKLATTFFAGSAEAIPVINFFAQMAAEANHFMAFPADEITEGSLGRINDNALKRAMEDGYLRRTIFSGTDIDLIELTPKFGHMFETAKQLAEEQELSD